MILSGLFWVHDLFLHPIGACSPSTGCHDPAGLLTLVKCAKMIRSDEPKMGDSGWSCTKKRQ